MDSIGVILSKARIKKKMTLEKAGRETRIKKEYLEALEKDDFNALPEDVYVRSFLEKYASFLELDSVELLKRYRELRPNINKPLRLIDSKFSLHTKKKSYLGLFLAALVVVAILAFSNYFKRMPLTKEPPRKAQNAPVEAAPETAAVNYPLILKIKGIDESSLVIKENNRIIFDGVISKGEEKEWQSESSFTLTIGNAGALELDVNGNFIGAIGRSGEKIPSLVVTPKEVYFGEQN